MKNHKLRLIHSSDGSQRGHIGNKFIKFKLIAGANIALDGFLLVDENKQTTLDLRTGNVNIILNGKKLWE